MTSKTKVAREVADADFVRMCESRRIDLSGMTPKEEAEFAKIRDSLIRGMCEGSLLVEADGTPSFTASNGERFTFRPPTGATFIATETHQGKIANMFEALADMSGRPSGDFSKLPARDAMFCMKLCNLFLADR